MGVIERGGRGGEWGNKGLGEVWRGTGCRAKGDRRGRNRDIGTGETRERG